jgi:hypothetical protein
MLVRDDEAIDGRRHVGIEVRPPVAFGHAPDAGDSKLLELSMTLHHCSH